MKKSSPANETLPAIWDHPDHTVLAATWHRWTRPALTTARQDGTRFTYPGWIEGWVDLGVGYIPKWFATEMLKTLICKYKI